MSKTPAIATTDGSNEKTETANSGFFGKSFPLFRLFGFSVGIDISWFFLALLIVWSLATAVFPMLAPDLSPATYWTMGVVGAIGVFVSIVLHELGHALVARRFGIPMRGITLFIFGGVAQMEDEPPNAKSEFFMAIGGPIVSIILAGAFGIAGYLAETLGLAPSVSGVLSWLGLINGVLVIFNMIPAFPLDGGRVLRSALWAWKHDFRKATRISASIGGAFGLFLLFVGILGFFTGNFVGGLWWSLIGLFLRGASQMSYRQALVREALQGERVGRFMREEPVTVSPDVSLSDLVENYVYVHHHKTFPVVENGKLIGCISTREVKEVPREDWDSRTVGDIVTPCDDSNTVSPKEDAMAALKRMNRTGRGRLLVAEEGRLVGIVALKDLLRFLSLKLDLEGDERASQQFAREAG